MATHLRVRAPQDEHTVSTVDLAMPASGRLEGRTLGSYRVLSLLGQGGMGSVYLAEHAVIGRKAALKVLHPEIAADPEAVSRFFTEARAVNDIRHPNIIEVTDFGQFESLYCIVMEYLEGETLAARLARPGTLDEASVVRIMKQCTSALGAAHDRGLVHRDIKPENIFLRAHPDYPDFVKVLDFGIAKLLGDAGAVGHHTKTGSVMGTPAYMSPEQCLGESALDTRSDIYSLGVVIYQMLTGRPPFSGETLGRLIVCHVSEEAIPPCVLNPGISRAMNDLVMRSLQKKPKDRFQNARDLREALERVLAPHQRVPTPIFGINVPGSLPLGHLSPSYPGAAGPASNAGDGVVIDAHGFPDSRRESGRAPAAPSPTPLTMPALRPGSGRHARSPTPHPNARREGVATSANQELIRRMTAIVEEHVTAGKLHLPDLPAPSLSCIELARRGRLGFQDAAKILGQDPGLRSRLMRLANSAAFPSLMPATTLELAVARLGAQGIVTALIEFSARETLEGRELRIKDMLRRIWPHAVGSALMAAELCPLVGSPSQSADAYLAGLLSSVGKPLVGQLLLEVERQMQRGGNRQGLAEEVVRATMDACHARAGAALCRRWEMPEAVALAVEGQTTWNAHQPDALSNLVRFSTAYASRLGLTVGNGNVSELDRVLDEGRPLLRLEPGQLRRLGHGFKERAAALARLRG
jgi:serine/threonine protein kinase